MSVLARVLDDLRAEGDELDALVAPLPAAEWARPTPAERWTISHQIAHLAWTDDVAIAAASDTDAFQAQIQAALADIEGYVDKAAEEGAAQDPADLLARWRAGRTRLLDVLSAVPDGAKLPWFGPPMSAASMATARLMETWAHGLDVYDALGRSKPATHRLYHVARLGVRTRNYSYGVHGLEPPASELRVELTGPEGELWVFGPEDATQRVTGSALDFAFLGTRRRNRADLSLKAEGDEADRWLDIVQTFAGPPGSGREPMGAAE